MSWFKHKHYWELRDAVEMKRDVSCLGIIRVEACSCGAVRTVEIYPGKAPIIYVNEPPETK